MNLVLKHEYSANSEFIDQFINCVKDSDLIFDSSDLYDMGINDKVQLEKAIERAQLTFSFAELDLSWHFKPYYIDHSGELIHAWRLSKMAFILSFLKADVYDKHSAELQRIMAKKAGDLFFNWDELHLDGNKERKPIMESVRV